MNCKNCGKEFEGQPEDEICESCYGFLLESLAKEQASAEWNARLWQEYWDEERRKEEERAEQFRKQQEEKPD